MNARIETKPCEFCGALVTKTGTQQVQRKYWTCGYACSRLLSQMRETGVPSGLDKNSWGKSETRACAECGKPVTRRLSQRTQATFWTCSRSCLASHRNKRLVAEGRWKRPNKRKTGSESPCETCGVPVYGKLSDRAQGHRRFCSRKCASASFKKTPVFKVCPQCAVQFERKPSQSGRQYCSQGCYVASKTIKSTYLDRKHNGRPVKRDKHGYLWLWEPDHPKAHCGCVSEHRWVVEQILGRYLERHEHVHHINENKEDNRPENLQVLNAKDHSRITGLSNGRKFAGMREELERYREKYGDLPD